MRLLIATIAYCSLLGCSTFHVGKECNYAYREVNGEIEKTDLSVCKRP